jgi:hypothetical protein
MCTNDKNEKQTVTSRPGLAGNYLENDSELDVNPELDT